MLIRNSSVLRNDMRIQKGIFKEVPLYLVVIVHWG